MTPRLLTYSLRSLWARRTTSFSTALGIAFLVFVLCASRMLSAGIRDTMASAGTDDKALILQHSTFTEDGSKLPESVLREAAAAPGVRRGQGDQPLVMGEIVAHTMMESTRVPGLVSTLQIRGVPGNVFLLRPDVRVREGRAITPGTSEALVGRGLLGRYEGLELGKSFELASGRPIRVVGVLESGGSAYESEVWVDLETAQSSLDLQTTLSSVTAQLADPSAFDGFAATLSKDKQTGLLILRERAYYERISWGLGEVVLILGGILGVIFSLGAVLGAMLALHASVSQRLAEIGVLRALGFQRGSILAAFLTESVGLSLAGAVLGVGLSLLTPFLDFSTLNLSTNQEVTFRFQPEASVLLIASAVALVVGLLGGALPSVRAARLDPVVALRGGDH
jgi:putative ABC transport system permease protein